MRPLSDIPYDKYLFAVFDDACKRLKVLEGNYLIWVGFEENPDFRLYPYKIFKLDFDYSEYYWVVVDSEEELLMFKLLYNDEAFIVRKIC